MYEVRISDDAYEMARQVAKAQHVSIEVFVGKAVRLGLHAAALVLTPDQMSKVRAEQEDVKAGQVQTSEEA